jgi:signal transduction histidine kinase
MIDLTGKSLASINGPPPAPPLPHRPGSAAPASVVHDEPINILIVDDEPKNLTVLETVLDNPGYRLVRAGSADEALLALLAEDFALLILDIRMPGMTGFELAQIIKERKKTAGVPIIFLTAYYNEDQHVLEGYGTGAVDYLHKPINPAILLSKVAVFAELHRKSRELELANRALLAEVTVRREAEEMLRTLARGLVQVQEDERGRVALELHDGITQLLCAIVFHSQTLLLSLTSRNGPAKREAKKLREMAGMTAGEVERISHNLRPSVLDQLGLVSALRETGTEFAGRTGLAVNLTCVELAARLPVDTEFMLYRIFQEALRNVEKHAHAHLITVDLTQQDAFVQLVIKDDGIGFDLHHLPAKRKGKSGLGLLSMRERAVSVGGSLRIKSTPGTCTEIEVRIPLPPNDTVVRAA